MNWFIYVGIYLFALYAVLRADANVIELTDDNFDKYLKKFPVIMVKFYAPWCGHCKQFAPEYEKAAKVLKELKKPYGLAKVDATQHKKLAERFKITGYPAIKLFISGTPIDYNGERKADKVVSFINKRTSPPSINVRSIKELKEIKEGIGLRVRLYYT